MATAELRSGAVVAVQLALDGADARGWEQLLGYVAELDDPDLEELQEAASRLGDAASEILGRRHS